MGSSVNFVNLMAIPTSQNKWETHTAEKTQKNRNIKSYYVAVVYLFLKGGFSQKKTISLNLFDSL